MRILIIAVAAAAVSAIAIAMIWVFQETEQTALDRAYALQDAGDIDGLVQMILEVQADEFADPYEHGTLVSWTVDGIAAASLRVLLAEDESARGGVEAALSAGRETAATPLKAAAIANALAIINAEFAGDLKRELLDFAIARLVADPDDTEAWVLSPEHLGLGPLPAGASADAILVVRRDVAGGRPSVVSFEPSLFGLTTGEIDAVRQRISSFGFVYRYPTWVGSYSGTCEGDAYRVDSHVFLLDFTQEDKDTGVLLTGGPPPHSTVTYTGGRCDGSGEPADHSGYLQIGRR